MPGGTGGGGGTGRGIGGGGSAPRRPARTGNDWPLPIRAVLAVLLVIILTLGWVLFTRGSFEADVFETVGLDPDWQKADPVALMVAGAFFVQLAVNTAILFILIRNRRNR